MKNLYIHISRLFLLLIFFAATARAQEAWKWEQVAPLQTARMGHCAAAFGNRIYVFGGMTLRRQMEITRTVEIYNPVRDEWVEGEPLLIPLYQASAVVSGGYIYILGGTSREGEPNNEIFKFDPRNNRHVRFGSLPHPRWAMGSVSVNRRVLIIGGITGRQEYRRDGYWWNPDSAQWNPSPQLNNPSAGFGLAFNGILWTVGGMSFGPMNRVEVLRNGSWELLPRRANLPEPRGELGVTFLGDTMLIAAGGIGRDGIASDVFALATDSLTWSRLPDLNDGRAEFSLITLQDQVYAVGGGTRDPNHMGYILSSVEVLKKANDVDQGFAPLLPTEFKPTIWPNPTNGNVTILLPRTANRLQMADMNGRIVNDTQIIGNANVWTEDASRYPAGRYQVIFFDAGGVARPAGGLTVLK